MKAKTLLVKINESVIDPVMKKLSPDLWSGSKLKPQARTSLLNFVNGFIKDEGIEDKVEKIILTGSSTTYQYSPNADVDINVSMKITNEKLDELKKKLADYNGKMFPNTSHPMNIFILNKEWVPGLRGPSYDLKNDEWEISPEKSDIDISYKAVLEIALSWARKIDLDIAEYRRDVKEYEIIKYHLSISDELQMITESELKRQIKVKKDEILADLDNISLDLYILKNFRSEPFTGGYKSPDLLIKVKGPNPNYTINNIVYKILERFGYFEALHKIVNDKDLWREYERL